VAKEYALKSGFKVFFIILGIIAMPIFLLGVPVLMIAFRSYAKSDEEGMEYCWLTTKRISWEELADVKRAHAAGVLGAMMAPHSFATVDGKLSNFPSGTFVGGDELVLLAKSRCVAGDD